MDTQVKIKIQSDADTRAFAEAQAKLSALQSRAKDVEKGFLAAGEAWKGVGLGFGMGIGGQVLTSLQQIPAALESAVMEGVRFNSTLESAKLGIAAVLKQFDESGRFSNFQQALAASGDAIDLLKEKAKTSPATFEQLVQGFQGLSGAYASAGLKMKEQVDLTVMISQALAGLGIRSDQLLQESRALVTGNITEDAAAAKILGITKAQVDAARSSGQLFEFLTEKLSAFSEAGAAGAQSYATQVSNIEDALQQLKGVATEEFFSQLKEGLAGVNEGLSSEQAEQWAAGLGSALSQIPEMAKGVWESLGKIGDALPGGSDFWSLKNTAVWKNWAPALTPAMDAKRQEQLDKEKLGLRSGLGAATDEASQAKAVAEVEKAIATRRAEASQASGEELQQLNNHVKVLEAMLARREKIFEATKATVALGIGEEAKPAVILGLVPTKEDAKAASERDKRAASDRKLAADIEAATMEDMGPRERALRLQQQMEEAKANLAADLFDKQGKIIPTGKDFTAEAAAGAIKGVADPEHAAAYEERLREILALEKDLRSTRKEAGDEAKKGAEMLTAATEELAIQREITAGHEDAARALAIQRDLRKELAKIEESDLAPAEKERVADLARQTAELQKQKIAADQLKKDQETRSKIERAEADNAVAAAEVGTGKKALRDAKLEQFRANKRDEFKDLPAAEAERLTADAVNAERRRLMREDGRIGGQARNVTPGSTFDDAFKGGGLRGTALDTMSAEAGMGDAAWAKLFQKGAAEMMPDMAPGALPSSGAPAEIAREEAGPNLSGKIQGMGAGVSAEVKKAALAVDIAKSEIIGAVGTLTQQINQLAAQMRAQSSM